MRRTVITYIAAVLMMSSCVPVHYIDPSGTTQGDYSRSNKSSREFYHQSMTSPIIVEYQNGTAKGKVLYEIDDPYVDISVISNKSKLSETPNGYFSLDDINTCLNFYILAQKAVMDDDLELANRSINKAMEIIELKPFYDLKGSIYYLSGDSIKANYYWNFLNLD